MSRAIQRAITNIFKIWPLVCGKRPTLLWKRVKNDSFRSSKLRRSQGCKVQVLQVGVTGEILVYSGCGWQDGWFDSTSMKVYLYIYLNYTYVEFSKFKLWFLVCILEVVKGHWPDVECLAQWDWISILKHFWFEVLYTLLEMANSCNRQCPTNENLLLVSSLSDLLWTSKNYGAQFSFKLKRSQTRLAPIYPWNIRDSHPECRPPPPPKTKTCIFSTVASRSQQSPEGILLERNVSSLDIRWYTKDTMSLKTLYFLHHLPLPC